MLSEHPGWAVGRITARARALGVVVTLALLVAACGGTQADEPDDVAASPGGAGSPALTIVATTTILGDVSGEIVGDAGDVSVLMPAGADPHTFEPSAQQLVTMHEADLIVANGANLEEHLQDPLAEVENAGVPVFHAVEHIDALTFGADEDDHAHADEHADEDDHAHDDDEHAEDDHAHDDEHAEDDHAHDHEEGSTDPHFWMDPTRMAAAVQALAEQMAALSDDPEAIQRRAGDYAGRLAELDEQISDTIAAIPDERRTMVTNHEAFNYFADRYGFTIVGTVIPSLSTGAEPSARELEALAHIIEDLQVRAIFAENTQPDQLAQNLAREVGADVEVIELYSDSLGEEGSDATTYIDMLQANADLISAALRT